MSSISKGLALELKSISENFIDSYLDSLKGIEDSEKIISEKITNEVKSYKIFLNVMIFNDSYKEDFKNNQWEFIKTNVIENIYKKISRNEMILIERVL